MQITIEINRRRVIWILGIIWALAWLGLLLEIYRWHHVTPSLHLNPPPSLPGLPPPHPGEFLIAVLASSMLAPPACIAVLAWELVARSRAHRVRH